jgi:hypothetical protein
MHISIAILMLSTALLTLQFFKQSMLSWRIAMFLSFLLLIFSMISIKNQNDVQLFTIRSLEKIAGRIFWQESELSISFQNTTSEIEPTSLFVQIKLLSLDTTSIPESAGSLEDVFRQCKKDRVFEYSYLPPQTAKKLFNAFAEKDGSIYDDKEENAGIERFWFSGVTSKKAYFDSTLVATKLVKGANVNSDFTSLSELNGSILLAHLNTGVQKHLMWPTALNWKLKSSAGYLLVHMPLLPTYTTKRNEEFIHKYVGICFPQRFFG